MRERWGLARPELVLTAKWVTGVGYQREHVDETMKRDVCRKGLAMPHSCRFFALLLPSREKSPTPTLAVAPSFSRTLFLSLRCANAFPPRPPYYTPLPASLPTHLHWCGKCL